MNMKWLGIASGIVLILSIPVGWSTEFYVLLRWFIFVSSLITAYGFYKSKINAWVFVFGSIAFLFNPIAPMYLPKSSWVLIDFISAILFFVSSSSIKIKK